MAKTEVECKKCGKKFLKENGQIKRSPNNFCTRSCAASFNGKKYPSRKPEGKCCKCNAVIKTKYKYCKTCRPFICNNDMTIKQAVYVKHHKSSAFALIRSRARTAAKKLGWSCCKKCGYNKHIEICHIKSISNFSEDTLLSIVNDISNLCPLCPNCHWEFDNGLLKL